MTASVEEILQSALEDLLGADAPLAERLDTYARVLHQYNRPFAESVDRLVQRLTQVGAGSSAPAVGDRMPDFLLPDDDGRLVSLQSLLGRGPLVLAFRRGHWCPYCLLSTNALARVQTAIARSGARLAVVTPEREAFGKLLKLRTQAQFQVFSDIDNGYALSIGLAIAVGDEMREAMGGRGRDLGVYQGNDAWVLPIPATYVIDSTGVVAFRHVDADYRRRADVEAILAAIDASSGT